MLGGIAKFVLLCIINNSTDIVERLKLVKDVAILCQNVFD